MRAPTTLTTLGALALAGCTLAIAGCTPEIPQGRIACTTRDECPPGWFCRASRCYADENGTDAGPVDGGTSDGATTDGGRDGGGDGGPPAPCVTDLDCSNDVFCDGRERCAPSDPAADSATGCAPPTGAACLDTQTCDESQDRCVTDCAQTGDADHDGENSLDCGGADCDDANADVGPSHAETCDAVDNDCDPTTFGTTDLDADGAVSSTCCNPGAGGGPATCGTDCDDARAEVGPAQRETCDGLDNDCNGMTDENVLITFYRDVDGDGYGAAGTTMTACSAPAGFAAQSGDCDDSTASVHPGVAETCNLVDDDCVGGVDDGLSCSCTNGTMQSCGTDEGECTHGMQSCSGGAWGTCMNAVGPAAETCNGLDDDCNATVDDGTASASCPARRNTTAACSGGTCRYSCTGTFLTCDSSDPGDGSGCEVDPVTDPEHCGGCTACTTPTNVATRTCAAGSCAVATCTAPFDDCDGTFSNGCERRIDTTSDCGACDSPCPLRPNTTPSCTSGACTYRCAGSFSDCDGNASNGCETGLPSCDAPPPRLIGPLTAMTVTSNRPELRFAPSSGTTQARVQVCSDPACSNVVWTGTGTSPIVVGASLAPGRYYWRAHALVGTTVGTTASATWSFVTFARTTPATATDGFPLMNIAGGPEDVAFGEPTSAGGRVYVYEGASSTLVQTLNAPANRQGFGSSISAIDYNGDGYDDLLVGACLGDASSSTAPTASSGCSGYVIVYAGDATGHFNTTPVVTLGNGNGTNRVGFGSSVAGIGDFNGDGYGDFVVGAYFSGRALIYLGRAGTGPLTEIEITPSGPLTTSRFGWQVAAAGDLDGDHFDDVLVGSYSAFGMSGNLNLSVVFGGTGTPAVLERNGSGPAIPTGLGDASGDGRADFATASPNGLGNIAVYRQTTRSSVGTVAWSLSGTSSSDMFGWTTMGPGDLDNDGLGDVVVGRPGTMHALAYQGTTGATIWQVTDSHAGFGRTMGRGGLLSGYLGVTIAACSGPVSCSGEIAAYTDNTPSLRALWSMGAGAFGAALSR